VVGAGRLCHSCGNTLASNSQRVQCHHWYQQLEHILTCSFEPCETVIKFLDPVMCRFTAVTGPEPMAP
jgi:hypothetical protein